MYIIRILLFSLFIVPLYGPGFAQTQDSPDPSELKLRIVEKQYDDVSDIGRWEVIVRFPALRLVGDKPAPEFDKRSRAIAVGEAMRFKEGISDSVSEGLKPPAGMNFYLTADYRVVHLGDQLVSILFEFSEYSGGAHPNHWTRSLNFSIRDGSILELSDVFDAGSEYLREISQYSIESLLGNSESDLTDEAWIRRGAGPDLKNFASWNAARDGLRITFDPYRVGPFAAGSFDVKIPWERFSSEIRGSAFSLVESVSYIDGSPPNWCRGGLWTVTEDKFLLAVVNGEKNSRAYFYGDQNGGPHAKDSRLRSYLIAGDEVIVKRKYGGFSCVWYQSAKGSETVGWIRSDRLEGSPDVLKPPRIWTGEWEYASNSIEIKETKGGKLHIYGTALWQGLGDNVHVGEIDYLATPVGTDTIEAGDGDDQYDCRVRLIRLGKYLIVSDNLNCGGVNVTFNGVYLQKRTQGRPGTD